MEYNKSDI